MAKYKDDLMDVWMAIYRGRLLCVGWGTIMEDTLALIDGEIDKGEWVNYKDLVNQLADWGIKQTPRKEKEK